MKKTAQILTATLVAALPLVTAASVSLETFRAQITAIPAPEIPAKTAAAVSAVAGSGREKQAAEFVKAAVQKSQAMAPEIVGAVARKSPDLAATAAAVAASVTPKQPAAIARVAAIAAPQHAPAIAAAVCREAPADFAQIAAAVLRVAPKSSAALLSAIVEALPNVKPFIDRAVALADGPAAKPEMTLAYAEQLVSTVAASTGSTSDRILNDGMTTAQQTQLSGMVLAQNGNGNQGVVFVPGGGKPGEENRKKVIVVEKGKGRDKDYSSP